MAPSMPSMIGNWSRCARSTARSTWRWVTWAISCESTAATSSSRSAVSTRPALTPMKPPMVAKALIWRERIRKKVNGWFGRSLREASR